MGLMMSFFVMLVAFSTQDQAKLQVVAGSMRDAFGVQDRVRYSGVIEVHGLPTRPKLKNVAPISPDEASATPTPDENGRESLDVDRKFALAAASLRQALQDMPEIIRIVQKHHDRGNQAGPEYRDRRSEWPIYVSGRLEGAL